MTVKSKFTKLFKLKIYLGFFFLLFVFLVLFFNLIADLIAHTYYKPILVLLGIVLLIIAFFFWSLFYVARLTIDDKGILNTTILTNKTTLIPYDVITKYKYDKVYAQSRGGNISDGYFVMVFTLKSGQLLEVSANRYENYHEIVHAIINKLDF